MKIGQKYHAQGMGAHAIHAAAHAQGLYEGVEVTAKSPFMRRQASDQAAASYQSAGEWWPKGGYHLTGRTGNPQKWVPVTNILRYQERGIPVYRLTDMLSRSGIQSRISGDLLMVRAGRDLDRSVEVMHRFDPELRENPSSPFHRKTNPRRKKLGDFPRVVSRALPEVDPVCDYCGTDELVYMGQMGRGTHAYRCRRCGMDKVTREENPRYRKLLRHGRKLNPTMRGIPSWMANDPSFRQELAAYTKRHGRGPVKITQVNVPAGYPKYMSVYGKAPEIKYDAPAHSNKGRRIHKFGEGGGRPPWLATSVSRGPKFLSFVGGTFKAKDWIYK
jgi:hypothetical protein